VLVDGACCDFSCRAASKVNIEKRLLHGPEQALGRSIVRQFRVSVSAQYPRRASLIEYQPNPCPLNRAS
jgi:hypothetical protein